MYRNIDSSTDHSSKNILSFVYWKRPDMSDRIRIQEHNWK